MVVVFKVPEASSWRQEATSSIAAAHDGPLVVPWPDWDKGWRSRWWWKLMGKVEVVAEAVKKWK